MLKKIVSISIIFLIIYSAICSSEKLTDKFNSLDDECKNIDSEIFKMIESINHSLVYQYHDDLMSFGPRYTGSQNCSLAGDYIYGAFKEMGYQTEKQPWSLDEFNSRNIEASLEGIHSNKVIYLLTAHYDCTPGSLGANDDGSGIAALLAIADVMRDHTFNNTIRFVAFSGEEVGTYGSFCYARDAYRNQDDIKAVLNIDMIGYANSVEGGKKIRFHYPKRSEWIVETAYEISLKYNHVIDMIVEGRPNYIGADHQSFVDYGYDGTWIAHPDSYPWANTPDDNPEHLNWSYQVKATQVICAILAEMANEPIRLHIQLLTPYEGYWYINTKPVIPLDFGRLWAKNLRGCTLLVGTTSSEAKVIADDPIEYVVFCLDNNFMQFDSSPPYVWEKIRGKHAPPFGSYTLRVYVYTTTGEVASDEMNIFSLSLNYYYRWW